MNIPIKNMVRTLVIVFALTVISASANAATFSVTTTNDTQDLTAGDGVCADAAGACSLRAAITEANALAGVDTITLPAGTYTETLVSANDNANAGGDFDITSDIIINGAGAGTTFVEANTAPGVATERVFHIRALAATTTLTVVINGLTVRHGRYTNNTFGAGIRIDQGASNNVTLNNLTVSNNLNATSGGGIAISGGTFPTVNITGSTIINNNAGSAVAGTTAIGGGILINVNTATVNISSTRITENTATSSVSGVSPQGAGISILGTMTITNSLITNNSATTATGNVLSAGVFVQSGTTTISNTDISNNRATVSGGTGAAFGGGIGVFGGTATLTNSTVNFNSSSVTGTGTGAGLAGGIYNQQATVNINNSTVDRNTASSFHAGVRTLAGTVAAVTNINSSTISNNSAPGEGGGVVNFSSGAFTATTNITLSTIINNSATAAGSVGGGIENFSTSAATGAATVNLLNSTVTGNNADNGGGIFNSGSQATVNLDFSTVASNTAATSGGGLSQAVAGVTNLRNSIVANNTAATAAQDIFGTITSQDYNHVENTAGGTFAALANDVTGSDPVLGSLNFNGGTTLNYLPGVLSPVNNTIPNGVNGCGTTVTTSQNAVTRPQETGCEKGSTERLLTTAATVSISGRVLTYSRRGVSGAVVSITDDSGNVRHARTNRVGEFRFEEVAAGGTYIIGVVQKGYVFAPRAVSVTEDISELDFQAQSLRHSGGR